MNLIEMAMSLEGNLPHGFDALDNKREHADDMAALKDRLDKMEQHIESDGRPTLLPGMKEEILDLLEPSTANLGPVSQSDDMHPHLFTNAKDALAFITAGNAYFTLRSKKTGTRYTYRVGKPKKSREKNEDFWYVSLLNGPDNEHNYTYAANMKSTSSGLNVWHTEKTRVTPDAPSMIAFNWMLRTLQQNVLHPSLEVWHEGRCGRCGRKLTVPESIAAGIGPECAGRR